MPDVPFSVSTKFQKHGAAQAPSGSVPSKARLRMERALRSAAFAAFFITASGLVYETLRAALR